MDNPVTDGPGSAAEPPAGRRTSTVRRVVLVLLAALPLALIGLRLYGEHRFEVVPEPLPAVITAEGTPLADAVRALLGRSGAVAGSAFTPLGDAHRALLARLALIELATRRIDVQYYLLEDDEVGQALLERLREAAARGVEVRVLLDDIGLVGRERLLASLAAAEPRLAVRVFNPTWLRRLRPLEYLARFPRANRRMHNKALIADGVAAIVGGRNIGNGYFDLGQAAAFEDMDVLAVGRVAGEVVGEFDAYWHSGIAVDIARLAKPTTDAAEFAGWRESRVAALAGYAEELGARDDIAVRRLVEGTLEAWPATAEVVHDAPHKVLAALGDTRGSLAPRILELLGSAREELVLSSPYLIPRERGMAVFRELRERGVRVRVLTNSFAANDVAAVHAGYRDYRRPLLELGVELHEFMPGENALDDVWNLFGSARTSLHAKAFVIDGERSFVGSFNLDPRSALHNTEMGIVIDGAAFGARLRERLVDALDERAWELVPGAAGGLEWHGRDSAGEMLVHHADPGTSWPQRTLVWLASWLPLEWLL